MYEQIKQIGTEKLFDELLLVEENIKKAKGELSQIYKHKRLSIKHELINRGYLSY